jgi:hypothetical protein
VEVVSARESAQWARLQAMQDKVEAQVHFSPVMLNSVDIPVVCPRVRVHVPRVVVPQIPQVRVAVQVR